MASWIRLYSNQLKNTKCLDEFEKEEYLIYENKMLEIEKIRISREKNHNTRLYHDIMSIFRIL